MTGTVAAAQPPGGTPWFLAGTCIASGAWFAGIGLAAHVLAPLLARPAAWRVLDLATGLTCASSPPAWRSLRTDGAPTPSVVAAGDAGGC